VEEGRILGLIGPNGAGKTTALNAILGLTSYDGQLSVLGRDPWSAREELMRNVSFIADVAVLPTLDPGFADARLCRGRASAVSIAPKAEKFAGEDHDPACETGQAFVKRDGAQLQPRSEVMAIDANCCGLGRADARSRYLI